jgi:predicted unusual protein kinase regulating ubiquinone biosynthesis (AarF/ABC1/UbiB family)
MAEEDEKPGEGLSGLPASKIRRAAKVLGTGAKVGANYIKYYAKKTVNPSLDKEELHAENAEKIFESLSELKGSALKVAQMMSMDNHLLPKAYQDKFAMAQYSAPPLSYPLVLKTFRQYFQKDPTTVFDTFSKSAPHAASIGQVHEATKDGKRLAVKIQYPGVADSISSDLKLIRPIAAQLFNMKSADLNMYMGEVEERLLEETDYAREMHNGNEIAAACAHIPNLRFPHYYEDLSNHRILTMDWIEGRMMPDFLKTDPPQEDRNRIGQAMWDFFLYQVGELRKVHADPHPGNFIVDNDGNLCVIDFGCVKEIPDDFFQSYFRLLRPDIIHDKENLPAIYEKLDLFKPEDTEKERQKLMDVYGKMVGTLGLPFHTETFDFSDESYFRQIFDLGEGIATDKEIRKMNNARGSKHGIYVMRTFFGLYNLLHQLRATVRTNYMLY